MPDDHDQPLDRSARPAEAAEPPESLRATSASIPVIGIGASAGGIEALAQLFDAMPADSSAAFVVVLHLDPTRESQLAGIIARHTTMPVAEITDGMQLAANHVYVIAPSFDLTLIGDTLRLTDPELPRGHRHPVDVLFKSLAEQRHERTVAIVLSGTGTNGTQGLREIKAAGGLALVQDPTTARFDGMPRSAIAAGLADHIQPPGDMATTALRYLRHGYVATPGAIGAADGRPAIDRLLGLVRASSGVEFRNYKPATLLRRISRRMSLRDLEDIGGYLTILQHEPEEARALVRDLLITVTSFFRDAEAWRQLDETVIAPLIADRETGSVIRVWVPACATGEEAYSVAMLIIEHAEAAGKLFDLKIFASDILDENLNVARSGVYPGSSVELLPPTRIWRFFTRIDASYRVRKVLRDVVVFARHDLMRDPPFSRMDMITCRNVLIYIEPEVQRRILSLFHFALREGGRLFLGSAETLGRADELFETLSKKWRIYRRIGPTRTDLVSFPTLGGFPVSDSPDAPGAEPPLRVTELARRALLDRYAPASVLIDQKGHVLYYHGDTTEYLKQPSGEPTRDLLSMAREGLLGRLRVALHEAIVDGHDSAFSAELRQGGAVRSVRVTLFRLPAMQQAAGLVLVTFETQTGGDLADAGRIAPPPPPPPDRLAAATLEDELHATRTELRSTIEQLEGVNEELKASNEEATSMNEELQSTNEELETSKEELQSFNEELHTVNNQLQHKIHELEEVGDDLSNLLSGTGVATLFLDIDLSIKWFSPALEQLLDLRPTDIGRPIGHFARKFTDDRLLTDAKSVLASLIPVEAEIEATDGKWFLRRLLPYRTRDNRIAGLVTTFVDITERRQANVASNEARIYAEAIVATARQPLVVLDAGLRVRSANAAFYGMAGVTEERAQGQLLYEVGAGEWDNAELRRLLDEVLPHNEQFEDMTVELADSPRGPRTVKLNARKLLRNGGRENLILLAVEDITSQLRAGEQKELMIGELNHRVKNVLAMVQGIATQTLRRSASLDVFRLAFTERLQALIQRGTSHDLGGEAEISYAPSGLRCTLTFPAGGADSPDLPPADGVPSGVVPGTAVGGS